MVAIIIFAWLFLRERNTSNKIENAPEAAVSTPQPTQTPEAAIPHEAPAASPTVTPSATAAGTPDPEALVKAREAARSHLYAAYTALQSFHEAYHRYSTDLDQIGVQPPTDMNYKLGFIREYDAADLMPHERPKLMNTDAYVNRKGYGSEEFKYTPEAEKINFDSLSSFCKFHCTANESEFEVIIAYPLGNDRFDVWTINSNKEIQLVQDGTQ